MKVLAIGTIAVALLGFGLPVSAGEDEFPCRATEVGRALDFWIGEWTVTSTSGEHVYGQNIIEWDAGGCAIHEYWDSARSGRATSLFYFAILEQTWHQVWVTSDTSLPWGLKNKELIDRQGDGTLIFQGQSLGEDGPYLDRTTLSPNEDGTVSQRIDISTDEGETWRAMFDAIYTPLED